MSLSLHGEGSAAHVLLELADDPIRSVYLLPQQTPVVDSCQISVMDLDQLVQVLGFLDLVLKLQPGAVKDLTRVMHWFQPCPEISYSVFYN